MNTGKNLWILCSLVVASSCSLVPQCDDGGSVNGKRILYYATGEIRTSGAVANCLWDGRVVNYYVSGSISSVVVYRDGVKNGRALYYDEEAFVYKEEDYRNDTLIEFLVRNKRDDLNYLYQREANSLLLIDNKNNEVISSFPFESSVVFEGNDLPFVELYKNDLLIKAKRDFIVFNNQLGVKVNLRDSIESRCPDLFVEDGEFLWNRSFKGDSIESTVYRFNEIQKVWEVCNHSIFIFSNESP